MDELKNETNKKNEFKKVIETIKIFLLSLLISLSMIVALVVVIGFVGCLINYANLHPSNTFQKISLFIIAAVGVYITWFMIDKDKKEK